MKMTIDDKLRNEIREWAMKKAMEDAVKSGKVEATGEEPKEENKAMPTWLQERFWHYEKMAYLKIHNRATEGKK